MVVLRQSGCVRAKVVEFGQTVVFGQKWLYSCKSGCIRADLLNYCISGCFRAKDAIFVQSCCIRAKVVLFGQSGYIRAKWE